MCEFLSAVKALDKNGKEKWYYLTHHLIHETPRGEMLQKKFPGSDELIGHIAIREYFGLRSGQGEDWEYSDFSTPENFSPVIVKAIKRGDFRGFGNPAGLLSAPAWEAFHEATETAWKAFGEAFDTAWEAYDEAMAPAWKAFGEAFYTAGKVYDEAIDTAEKVYDEAMAPAFWDLFALPENRTEVWR